MRRLNDRFRTSEISVTSLRFGKNRRRDLLLAWLTVLPDIGPLPVSSQTRDMVVFLVINGPSTPASEAMTKFDFRLIGGIGGGVKRVGRGKRGFRADRCDDFAGPTARPSKQICVSLPQLAVKCAPPQGFGAVCHNLAIIGQ